MLVIRFEQMKVFHQTQVDMFVGRVRGHLRATQPALVGALSAAALDELLRRGIARAADHGVEFESDVRRYLEYALRYGPAFDEDQGFAWAGEILRDPSATGTEKMDRIDQHALTA